MPQPLFSVVIACYNHEEFVRDAVESALEQQHPGTEIIAVDDASTDGTAEILRSFGDSIVIERLPVNGGAGAARNHGAAVAKGKYLVFLDGDDVLTRWSLRVYGRIIAERSPAIILGRSSLFYGRPPTIAAVPSPETRFVEYASFLDKDRSWVYNTSSLVVERTIFHNCGGFSADIFCQDIQDLLNKLCVQHKTILLLAPDTVLYRMHATNTIRQVGRFIEGIRVLRRKARRGAYPGGRALWAKRSAWFGGLIFYWAKAGMRNGLLYDGLKLLLTGWWMILLAVIRRAVALVALRKPIEVLTFEPDDLENSRGAHPMRLHAGHLPDNYGIGACGNLSAHGRQRGNA